MAAVLKPFDCNWWIATTSRFALGQTAVAKHLMWREEEDGHGCPPDRAEVKGHAEIIPRKSHSSVQRGLFSRSNRIKRSHRSNKDGVEQGNRVESGHKP